MEIERALQADHSDYMRIVAQFVDEEAAANTHEALARHLDEVLAREERVRRLPASRLFQSEDAFQAWKQDEWDPISDEGATLHVQRQDDGRVRVQIDRGLVLNDWGRDHVGVALRADRVAIRVYTCGDGIDYVDRGLSERGGDVDVEIEGCEYLYVGLDAALEEVQAASDTARSDGVRASIGPSDPA